MQPVVQVNSLLLSRPPSTVLPQASGCSAKNSLIPEPPKHLRERMQPSEQSGSGIVEVWLLTEGLQIPPRIDTPEIPGLLLLQGVENTGTNTTILSPGVLVA